MDTGRFEETIRSAIADLGPLTIGQRVDLLLDNHMDVRGPDHAREILCAIQSKYATGRDGDGDEPIK